jgi:UDP-N-acetylglucosamine 2-epimerase (non-hydrolysing)
MKKKILSVVGARPNFMKLAPVAGELRKYRKQITHRIVHTGQHYDYKLSQVFFRDLDMPKPDIYLGVGSASHAEQTAKIIVEFEKIVLKEKPDMVLVFGDVNSTIACSLVCSKIIDKNGKALPVAHIESGLRSFDKSMPEEINRIVTDALSEILFVTEKVGVENLINEGVDKKRIFLVGDTMVDALIQFRSKFRSSGILGKLKLKKGEYALATIHRPGNVDDKRNLAKIISIFQKIAAQAERFNPDFKIVFPVHPRTMKMINTFGLTSKLASIENIVVEEPAGYTDFIKLLIDSKFVMTDSGGIQEEATFLKIPCLTLRDSFERLETLELGTNTLCSLNERLTLLKVNEIFSGKYKKGRVPKLMDGKASNRIVKVISNYL